MNFAFLTGMPATSGQLAGSVGGPGEHQLLVALWRAAADSLITYDARNSRVSYWTAHGDFSRDIAVDPGTRIVGPLSPGWFLGVRLPPQFPLADGKTRTDTAVFVRVSPAADSTIHLALSPWQTYYGATTPAGDVLTTPLPLEPKGVAAIGTSTVYIGYGNAWRIEQYSLAGEQLESIIAAIERRPLTGELRDRWQAPFLEKVSLRERPAMRRYLSSLPYPDSLPAMDLMIVDELENLWIRQFALPAEDSATWFVFSSQGEQVATLRLSTTLRPLQIGDDFLVAGVSREALGEEVVVFALER